MAAAAHPQLPAPQPIMPSGEPSWWTNERVAELKARWRDNQTASQISAEMGAASRNAVIGKARRLDLPMRVGGNHNAAKSSTFRHSRKAKTNVDKPGGKPVDDVWITSEMFKNPKTIIALGNEDCHFPGDGSGSELLYCGAPVWPGRSYCAGHCRIAFVKPPKHAARS